MKKFILLAGILMLLSACAEDKSNDSGTNSYQVTGKVIYTADNFKSAKVCVDANNNGLADDAYCTETANDGSYSFISNDSISSYPLAASITTANTAVNAKLNNGEILMYAPKGKTDVISIETTLIKSIMEQNSTKTYDMADAEVAAIMKKTDNTTLLTVYTNALNSADIQNWESSIRGIVGAVTNKLLESTEITADTIITVTQEEVDNINNIIKEEDNKEPENPSYEPATPLEKVTEILAGAEIKNSAENPVNLNEHLDRTLIHHNQSNQITNFIGIKYDTFGEFSKLGTFTNTGTLLMDLNYKENNWPSDSPLHFEVFPDSNSSTTGQNGYFFSNHYYKYHQYNNNSNNFIADSICLANGKVNGIYYKPLLSDTVNAVMESDFMQCLQNSDVNTDESAQISQEAKCLVDTWYYYKDSIKLEKWYWTIDTTQLSECKQSLTPLEKITEILAGAEIKNSAENPVNLNEHLDRTLIHHNQSNQITNFIGIKYDTFGEFSESPTFTNVNATMKDLNYKENNWPSDSSLHFEVFPDSSSSTTGQNGYFFSNHYYKYQHESGNVIADNICSANGKVNGVFYKPIVSDTEMAAMQSDAMQCAKNSGINIDENGQISQDDTDKMLVCFADIWFQHKNNYKLEKWYWTIDTSLLEECK